VISIIIELESRKRFRKGGTGRTPITHLKSHQRSQKPQRVPRLGPAILPSHQVSRGRRARGPETIAPRACRSLPIGNMRTGFRPRRNRLVGVGDNSKFAKMNARFRLCRRIVVNVISGIKRAPVNASDACFSFIPRSCSRLTLPALPACENE